MAHYLGVAIDVPMRQLFDYLLPANVAAHQLYPGQRLWVPFGKRRTVGILVEQRTATEIPHDKLRRAHALIDAQPVLDKTLFELLKWSADYYHHPIGEVLAGALPAALRAGQPAMEQIEEWRLTETGRAEALAWLPARARKFRAVVERLAQSASSAQQLASVAANWREMTRKLHARGYVESVLRTLVVQPTPFASRTGGPPLSAEQATAVARIQAQLGKFETLLLYGVTGSGKTEVYLRAIEQTLLRGEQALVLVPEIALTPQLVGRFRERFDVPLAVLHSSLNDSERLQAWRNAKNGAAPIVIGTRSAVFAPLAKPGLIVVDEEHDPSYKQQEGFRYSARDLAIARAQRHGIPVVLGSATPSLESLSRAQRGRGQLVHLPKRAANAQPPRWSIIDLRQHAAAQGIATPTLQSMSRHLSDGGQVLLYLNRRGYAPTLFCPSCGWCANCRRCDARLTIHLREGKLRCHHCGFEQNVIEICAQCSAPAKAVGQGTQRIEETLQQLFPGMPLGRVDRDAMRRRGALEDTLDQVNRGEVRILIGTQMLTKGHHFPLVTLVVVLNADQGLFGTDFRASERLAQTIVQVAGRAGRAQRAGEVIIQTEYPLHPLLQRLTRKGYTSFAEAALAERQQAEWPPYARLALIRAEASQMHAPLRFLDAARALAASHINGDLKILGPAAAPMERRAGRFRAQLLLRAGAPASLQRLLAIWIPLVEKLPDAKRVRWSVDVDPAELF